MDDMDDVLESGGCRWRTHNAQQLSLSLQVTALCGVTNHPPTPLPVILFIFLFFSEVPILRVFFTVNT